MATGGFGRIFNRSTNALINTGDGQALALDAGVPLKDMEFVQFHPTTLYGTNILMSEGARGEGGILLNKNGERFMKNYAPNWVMPQEMLLPDPRQGSKKVEAIKEDMFI